MRFKPSVPGVLLYLRCILFPAVSLFVCSTPAISQSAQKAQVKVSGKVTDEKGVPVTGVSVQVKGGKVVAVTSEDGQYTASVDADAVLIFSAVSFAPLEMSVQNRESLNVTLQTKQNNLEDVVVVGYGTQKKRAITGAIASVGYEQFKDRAFANVAQSLEGAIAGVNITTTQGAPGYSPTIKIRGTSSITSGTTPLYVVDGMALENYDLNQLNPQDIQSIEVLKDASSSAIYGSRGANGVIIVTTKLGKVGKPQVSANFEYGISKVNRTVDMMDAQQWISYYVDARNNAWVALDPVNNKATDDNAKRSAVAGSGAKNYLIPPDFISNPASFGAGTNWQDVVFRTAPMVNGMLSLSGASNNTSYLFSLGYLDQQAVVIKNFYQRLTIRTNIRQKINDKIAAGLNLGFTASNDRTDGTTGKSDVISLGIQSDPIFPEYNENGYLGFLDPNSKWSRFQTYGVQLWNPHSLVDYADKLNKRYNTLGNAYLEIKPIKELTLKGSLGGNLLNTDYNWYWITGQGYGYSSVLPAQATAEYSNTFNWLAEATASYDKTWGKHRIGAIAGYTSQKQRTEGAGIAGTNFPNDLVRTINAAGTISRSSADANSASEWSLLSMLGRVTYAFNNKYFLNGTIRRDGSSRFGDNSKWGTFPSVGASWLISDEGFMQGIKSISALKLRASYGRTGNNLIPNYGAISLVGTSQYASGTNSLNGIRPIGIANSDLRWELTDQFNLGFDLGMFNNRLNVMLDLYQSKTNDMLLNVPVPAYSGFTSQLTNIGSMENKGIELTINSKNIVRKDFNWTTDFNYSMNRNKVTKLGPNNTPIEINEWGLFKTEVGQPVSNYVGFVFTGVYNTQAQVDASPHYPGAAPGDPIIADLDGDKTITNKDVKILGNIQPDFTAGMTNNFDYKGFEFSFMLQAVVGGEIWNQQTRFSKFWNDSRNSYASSYNYWRSPENPGDGKTFKPYATYPATTQGKASFIQGYSDYWMENGTYLRIKNIRIGYRLPENLSKKVGMKSVRVYANAENVYVFSKYVGFDPANSTYSASPSTKLGANGGASTTPPGLMLGADYGAYPIPFMLTFGIKADL